MSPITLTTRQTRQTRSDSRYNDAERAIIGVYKTEYREQTTRDSRGKVMKEKILPAIFNYWTERRGGEIFSDEESKPLITVRFIHLHREMVIIYTYRNWLHTYGTIGARFGQSPFENPLYFE